MSTESAIVQQVRARHDPVAILLHGSRASGHQRPHSDWDLLLLFQEEPEQAVDRVDIVGEDVEWQALRVPFPDAEFLRRCGVWLQFARVLWEDDAAAGSALLAQAGAIYRQGVRMNAAQRAAAHRYLAHKANGMADDIDTPHLFLRHQHVFFERASNLWFELRGEYRKPLHIAMPTFRERDPAFFRLLGTIAGPGPNPAQVAAAREVVSRLFDTGADPRTPRCSTP